MTYRNTKQRKDVYEVLKGLNKHLTADQVMDALTESNKKVGLATVYRSLNHLYEHQKIGRIVTHGITLYDGNPEPHDHLHCKICDKFFDVPRINNKESLNRIQEETGYSIDEYFITYEGICTNCKEK
ncbi:MAG TPA: transcriptional repressor [Erysipelotrichaceae bacterium]|nr:transcriptional repressor [Bacillota bacterium]HCY06076.1 transcriptional repressor [Erysipelotrichaceae bacterium]